ncbi:hypothetical protein ScPMuIL_003756 [Solemya velum]
MGKYGVGKLQRSKKHRKLKVVDQFAIGDRTSKRNDILPNQRPKNEEEQEIPRKLKFYINKKDELKNYSAKKHKRKKKGQNDGASRMEPGMTRPLRPAPKFVQHKGENDKKFLSRVDKETQHVILKAQLEDQYGVELHETKDGTTVKKAKGMSDKKRERLKEHKERRKMKKASHAIDKDMELKFKDEVKFGEVVMEPPVLTAKPRKAQKTDTFSKPGKKSLLLKEIIEKNSGNKREPGQTQKRKHMSFAQQRIMDAERQKAIEQYRNIKNKKMKTS